MAGYVACGSDGCIVCGAEECAEGSARVGSAAQHCCGQAWNDQRTQRGSSLFLALQLRWALVRTMRVRISQDWGCRLSENDRWRLRGHVSVASDADFQYLYDSKTVVRLPRMKADTVVQGLIGTGAALPQRLLDGLLQCGFVTTAPVADSACFEPRLERNLRYIELFCPDAASSQKRLQISHVAIIGCGGIGGLLAVELAAAGVGKLSLYDPDVVEVHNLNRQHCYSIADIGRPKVLALSDRLTKLAPEADLRPFQVAVTSAADIKGADGLCMVVVAADSPYDVMSRLCSEAALESVPRVQAAVGAGTGYVGPIIEGDGKEMLSWLTLDTDSAAGPASIALSECATSPMVGSFGPSNSIVASMLAHEVLVDLMTSNSHLRCGRLVIDLMEHRIDFLPINKDS